MSNKKVLMVLTSHAELGDSGEKTGFWIEEFAAPYYALVDAGVEVTLASPVGGQAPIDPKSELPDFQTEATARYYADAVVQKKVAETQVLSKMNAEDYSAVFYPGGHGQLWDLTDNTDSINLIQSFLQAEKPVATVCHASTALLNVKYTDGNFSINNKAVTGFSNSEEVAVQLENIVPFMLQDELEKRGSNYQSAADWTAFAIQDGLIITGQNPASSELAAKKLLASLAS